MFEAVIRLLYGSVREAEAVAEAVSPDNVTVPRGLSVKTVRRGCSVLTEIVCESKFLTFLATVDDFLSAVSVAEKSVSAIRK